MKIKKFFRATALFMACVMLMETSAAVYASSGTKIQENTAEEQEAAELSEEMSAEIQESSEKADEQNAESSEKVGEQNAESSEEAGEQNAESSEKTDEQNKEVLEENPGEDALPDEEEEPSKEPSEQFPLEEAKQDNNLENTEPEEEPEKGPVQEIDLILHYIERSEKGILLSFPLVSGIDKYEIYRCAGEEEELLLAELEGVQTESETEEYQYLDETATELGDYTYVLYGYAVSEGEQILAGKSESVTAEYVPEVLRAPERPEELKVESEDYRTLRISWGGVQNASGYEVWRAVRSSGEYVLVKNIQAPDSGDTISWTDTGLTLGTEYLYKIRAFVKPESTTGKTIEALPALNSAGEALYSEYTAPISGTPLPGPITGISVQATRYNTIQLDWDKVPGAKGYEVYYSTAPDGEYKLLKSLTRNTYKYTKALCGTVYYFKIRAYQKVGRTTVYGNMSSQMSAATALEAPNPYVYKTTYNSITLKWKKVTGATSYQIWLAESENGPFEKLKTVRSCSFSHKKLQTGKDYYYKITAVRKDYNSEESEVLSAAPEFGAITGLKAAAINTGSVKISWKRVTGIKTYVVERYRTEADAIARTGAHETESTRTSYTDTGLRENTTYYYCVYGKDNNGYESNVAGPVKVTTKKAASRTGVDVSSYQGTINWDAAADDGVNFAMLRILLRGGNKDSQFERNYKNARAAGIKVGVYRYSYAQSVSEIKEEAREVVRALNGRKLDYPVALDMEDSSQTHLSRSTKAKMIRAYKDIIEDAGYKFVLYANTNWLNNQIDMNQLTDVDVWVARYRSFGLGHGYTGPGNVVMWQYTSSGSVDGIAGKVDMDVSYKNY